MRTVHLLNRNDLAILTRGTAFDIRCPCGLTHSVQSERAYARSREPRPPVLALPPHPNGHQAARAVRRKTYSDEFKRKAVVRVMRGESPAAVCRALGICHSMLFNWRARVRSRA